MPVVGERVGEFEEKGEIILLKSVNLLESIIIQNKKI